MKRNRIILASEVVGRARSPSGPQASRFDRDAHTRPIIKLSRMCLFAGWLFSFVVGALAETSPTGFDPKTATFDELLFHAQRFGNTSNKMVNKDLASTELMARGAESLRYFMQNIHLDNITIQVLSFNLVESLPASNAVPILLPFLQDSHSQTRKVAAFFLGFYPAPEHAGEVIPLLKDEEAAGAAMRTLGKWRVRQAVTNILPFLSHEREVRRVAAANALRDIGDPVAVPALILALNDPVFTVREAAARALSRLGVVSERALLQALPAAKEPAKRHIIRILGAMKSRHAQRMMRQLAFGRDPWARRDAQEALRQIRSR
jgi:hypothetical protein